jgi:hypothetical protein
MEVLGNFICALHCQISGLPTALSARKEHEKSVLTDFKADGSFSSRPHFQTMGPSLTKSSVVKNVDIKTKSFIAFAAKPFCADFNTRKPRESGSKTSCFCWSSFVSSRTDSKIVVRLCCSLMNTIDRLDIPNLRCLATVHHVVLPHIRFEDEYKYLLILRIQRRLSTLHYNN